MENGSNQTAPKKTDKLSEHLSGFQVLLNAVHSKVRQTWDKVNTFENDMVAIMERQLTQEGRLRMLERAAGFRTPIWKRLIGKKDHLAYDGKLKPEPAEVSTAETEPVSNG
jgi:hypothetical protein